MVRWLRWGAVLQDFEKSWSKVTGGVEGAQLDGAELSHDPNHLSYPIEHDSTAP